MALHQVVFSHAAKTPALQARLAATMEHQLPPQATFPVQRVLWWTLGAAFRGSLRVIPEFTTMARRGSANDRELRFRQRLLAEAEASEARATRTEMTPLSMVLPRAAQGAPRRPRGSADERRSRATAGLDQVEIELPVPPQQVLIVLGQGLHTIKLRKVSMNPT